MADEFNPVDEAALLLREEEGDEQGQAHGESHVG